MGNEEKKEQRKKEGWKEDRMTKIQNIKKTGMNENEEWIELKQNHMTIL